jgi:hypothetical protein
MMKPIATLTVADLQSTPVWRYHDAGGGDDNGALVEPTNRTTLADGDNEVYIAAAIFTLVDGSAHLGYCSPSDPSGLDYVQPVVVTSAGPVRFWFDRPVSLEELAQQWALLDRTEDQIFPVRWHSIVPVDGRRVEGVVEKADVLAQAS